MLELNVRVWGETEWFHFPFSRDNFEKIYSRSTSSNVFKRHLYSLWEGSVDSHKCVIRKILEFSCKSSHLASFSATKHTDLMILALNKAFSNSNFSISWNIFQLS